MRNAHVRDIRVIDMLVIKVRFAVQNINTCILGTVSQKAYM